MKNKKLNNTLGFTLVELILALALISFVIIVSFNLISFGSRAQRMTFKEYSLQSDIRRASEMTNEVVRYSKAVFAVPDTFVESDDVMDPGWNYLMVSRDGKRIIKMEYDEDLDKHIEITLVEESEGILYRVNYEKDETANSDSVLKFKIFAYNTDDSGNIKNERLVLETSVETVNAIQVVDKGSVSNPSIALAYRDDGQTSGKGKNQIAYITILVDVSGSMLANPDGEDYRYLNRWGFWVTERREYDDSRIVHVRKALVGDSANSISGIIQQFSKEENVFISLVPFSTTANHPEPTANSNPSGRHKIYDVFDINDKNELLDTARNMVAVGGTNTGDGLRQAYYLHDDFRSRMNVNDKDQVHHYMILLVDGETTYEVNNGTWNDNGGYYNRNINEIIGGRNYRRYDWRTDWRFTSNSNSFYLGKGNINISNQPADDPLQRVWYGSTSGWNSYYRVEYGERNSPVSDYSITGNGSTVITKQNSYVRSIGNLIKSYNSNTGIKSYVIGYASNLGNHVNTIGSNIGTDSTNIYKYDDPGFNLDEIFKNIATDIMADFWLATGPQIIK